MLLDCLARAVELAFLHCILHRLRRRHGQHFCFDGLCGYTLRSGCRWRRLRPNVGGNLRRRLGDSRPWHRRRLKRLGRRQTHRTLTVHCLFVFGNFTELILRELVIFCQDLFGLHLAQVLDGNIAFHARENAAAFALYRLRVRLDLDSGVVKELVKFASENIVPNGHAGQRIGVVERFS